MKLIAVCLLTLTCCACAVMPWPTQQDKCIRTSKAQPAEPKTLPSTVLPVAPTIPDCSEDVVSARRARHEANEWRAYAEKLEKLLDIPKKSTP